MFDIVSMMLKLLIILFVYSCMALPVGIIVRDHYIKSNRVVALVALTWPVSVMILVFIGLYNLCRGR